MKREDIEKAAVGAIHENYGCNGKYPCTERDYCIYGTGKNTAFDCNECGADEFNEGFIAGAEWRINSVWHDASERPEKKHANCLVEVKEGDFSFFLVSEFYQNGGFSFMNGICNLILKRWAYIKDLTPNTEE